MLLRFPQAPATAGRATSLPTHPTDSVNQTATSLTLLAAAAVTTAPAALAGPRTEAVRNGIRGQLESLAGREGPSDTGTLQIRFSAPTWEEMEYARALGNQLGSDRSRAEQVVYRALLERGDKVLLGRGVRVDLGDRARAERVRFPSSAAARRFAVLYANLGEGAAFIEVRGRQIGILRGSAIASSKRLLAARSALWSGLPAPRVSQPALLMARPRRETLILHGNLDYKSRGVLRELVDGSVQAVDAIGSEEARAPQGEMRQDERGRVRAWLETQARRRETVAALSESLARISQPSRSANDALRTQTEPKEPDPAPQPAPVEAQPKPQPRVSSVAIRVKVDVSLRAQPAGTWSGELRAGERCLVVGRRGAWLEVTDRAGRALGWVLYDAAQIEIIRPVG